MHTKFGDSRFSSTGDMIAGVEIENRSCDYVTRTTHHLPVSSKSLDLIQSICVQNCTILGSSFSRSRDITRAPKFKVGYVTLTTLGVDLI